MYRFCLNFKSHMWQEKSPGCDWSFLFLPMCDGVGCEGNSLSMDGGGGIIDCRDWSNSDETTDAIEFT